MIASVLAYPGAGAVLEELLQPEPVAPLADSEQRIIVCGVSWKRYLGLDKNLGNDRPGPRLSYLEGELEIMTTSNEHERIKEWIGGLLEIYFDESQREIVPRGQATMRLSLKQAGAEPDKSWCIGREKTFPDLVLEVALTSGGVNKLEIYRRLKVPEVWFWRRDRVEIFALSRSGVYARVQRSRLLPGLNTSLLQRCVATRSWQQARRTFRAGLFRSK
jgi:Uma2 family endonuclease